MCDLILSHNRLIRLRADDSVMDFHRGQPYMIRRSRGYAPLPVMVSGNWKDRCWPWAGNSRIRSASRRISCSTVSLCRGIWKISGRCERWRNPSGGCASPGGGAGDRGLRPASEVQHDGCRPRVRASGRGGAASLRAHRVVHGGEWIIRMKRCRRLFRWNRLRDGQYDLGR